MTNASVLGIDKLTRTLAEPLPVQATQPLRTVEAWVTMASGELRMCGDGQHRAQGATIR